MKNWIEERKTGKAQLPAFTGIEYRGHRDDHLGPASGKKRRDRKGKLVFEALFWESTTNESSGGKKRRAEASRKGKKYGGEREMKLEGVYRLEFKRTGGTPAMTPCRKSDQTSSLIKAEREKKKGKSQFAHDLRAGNTLFDRKREKRNFSQS